VIIHILNHTLYLKFHLKVNVDQNSIIKNVRMMNVVVFMVDVEGQMIIVNLKMVVKVNLENVFEFNKLLIMNYYKKKNNINKISDI